MKKSLQVASRPVDPTLPFTEIEVGGRTLKMCLNFRALAAAEASLNAQGRNVQLLAMLPRLAELNNTLTVFACSLQHYQPEIGFEEAVALPDLDEVYKIADVLNTLWQRSTPEPENRPGPPQPGEEPGGPQ